MFLQNSGIHQNIRSRVTMKNNVGYFNLDRDTLRSNGSLAKENKLFSLKKRIYFIGVCLTGELDVDAYLSE